jgi:hypothetical protein
LEAATSEAKNAPGGSADRKEEAVWDIVVLDGTWCVDNGTGPIDETKTHGEIEGTQHRSGSTSRRTKIIQLQDLKDCIVN